MGMSKNLWIIVAVVIIVVVGGFIVLNTSQTPSPTPTPTDQQTTAPVVMEKNILLSEQNDSGVSGSAVLREEDGRVIVTLNITGFEEGIEQPAHIHTGACPDVGGVTYSLTNVLDGVSETILDVTLEQLAAELPLAINVHKSVPEVTVYVSCGDLAP